MTPEEAKTKIEALLNLGTLQGVRVEYDGSISVMFYKSPVGYSDGRNIFYEADGVLEWADDADEIYQDIKSIHPIPMEPKLLEVGMRVKIVGGELKGKSGKIDEYTADGIWYTITVDGGGRSGAAVYNVIPESLLVEEEEKKEEFGCCIKDGDDEFIKVEEEEVDATEIAVNAIKKERHKMTDPAVYSILIQEDKDQLDRIEEQLRLLNKQAIK